MRVYCDQLEHAPNKGQQKVTIKSRKGDRNLIREQGKQGHRAQDTIAPAQTGN